MHVFGADARGPKRPAVVFFHGGGWRGGSREMLAPQTTLKELIVFLDDVI